MRARGRHAKPSRLRNVTYTAGISAAVVVPLTALSATPASAQPAARPATASVAHPTLSQGSRGPAVVDLQRRLGLAADGAFGPLTRRAVVAFQAGHGLVADGVVGPRTWAALGGGAAPAVAVRVVAPAPAPVAAVAGSSRGAAAVAEASRHVGQPYVFGAAGPRAFDCSGFTQYVYRQVGVNLPRTAAAQAAVARPVAKSQAQLGDLVIFREGGRVSHVGIYAGGNTMWVARHTGTTITRQVIYTSSYSLGRVS